MTLLITSPPSTTSVLAVPSLPVKPLLMIVFLLLHLEEENAACMDTLGYEFIDVELVEIQLV